jgi:hypothetical protein
MDHYEQGHAQDDLTSALFALDDVESALRGAVGAENAHQLVGQAISLVGGARSLVAGMDIEWSD